jgi:hypothetical protein
MTGRITLVDHGQNYIVFEIVSNIIKSVTPSGLQGWNGTQVLNKAFFIGGRLAIDLQWKDYNFPLQYPIVKIEEETG